MGASGAQRAGGGRGVDEGLEGSRGSGGLRAGQEVSPQLLWVPGVPGVHWVPGAGAAGRCPRGAPAR